jgi:hypothetical protein
LLPLSCSREAGRAAQRHALHYGVNRSRFFERGSFLGEWWDPWRSSETSINGVVIKVSWNVLIDRDEERDSGCWTAACISEAREAEHCKLVLPNSESILCYFNSDGCDRYIRPISIDDIATSLYDTADHRCQRCQVLEPNTRTTQRTTLPSQHFQLLLRHQKRSIRSDGALFAMKFRWVPDTRRQ